VNNRDKSLEVGEGGFPDVFADPAMTFQRRLWIAVKVKIRIQSRNVVTMPLKPGSHDRPDVPSITR